MHTASFIDLKQFSLIPKIRKRFSREREKRAGTSYNKLKSFKRLQSLNTFMVTVLVY